VKQKNMLLPALQPKTIKNECQSGKDKSITKKSEYRYNKKNISMKGKNEK
jgi:hypothetical protein